MKPPPQRPVHRVVFALVSGVVLMILPPAAGLRAQDCLPYQDHLHLRTSVPAPGYVSGSAVDWPWLYANTDGETLNVFDISDPDRPVLTGSVPVTTNRFEATVAAAAGRCYLLTYPGTIWIVDVGEPTSPVLAGSFEHGSGSGALVASRDLLYVGAGSAELAVYDVADPVAPELLVTVPSVTSGSAMTTDGEYLYLVGADLVVFSLADPTVPVVIGACGLPGDNVAYAVGVDGGVACVGVYDVGMHVVDVSDPEAPTVRGSLAYAGSPNEVLVRNGVAYMSSSYNPTGLIAVDISDPQVPVLIASFGFFDYADELWWHDGILGVTHSREVHLLDIQGNSLAPRAATLDTPGLALGIASAGDLAFVADYDRGLQVIDVALATAPVMVAAVATPGFAWDVAASDGRAYVANFSGLTVVDATVPSAPFAVGQFDLLPNGHGVAVMGDLACVTWGYAEDGGLALIDVSDPVVPVEFATVGLPDSGWGVDIGGDLAYVGHGWTGGGMMILDVGDPAAPQVVGTLTVDAIVRDVAVAEGYAYLAADAEGLLVVDVRDPTLPVVAFSFRIPGGARAVSLHDGVAHVAAEDAGVHLFDIADPASITSIGFLATESEAWGVAFAGGHVLVADYESGLAISPVACPPLATVPGERPPGPGPLPVDNFPNPFNPRTTIRFTLAVPAVTDLVLFDLAGRTVRVLLERQPMAAGARAVPWDGRDDQGRVVASGAYLARLRAGSRSGVARMILLR